MITKFQRLFMVFCREICFLLCCLLQFNALGQNIITDYSFEQSPSYWGEVYSVDYLVAGECFEGYATPTHGNRCAGLRLYSPNDTEWHEYVYQPISMIPNMTYEVSFTYQLAQRTRIATDDLGVAFTTNLTENNLLNNYLNQVTPQLRNPENNVLSNNDAPALFRGFYTASGLEDFIAIGTFTTDNTISVFEVVNTMEPARYQVYYFIDEVIVRACPHANSVNLPDVITLCNETSQVTLSPSVSGATYEWSTGSTDSAITVPYTAGPLWVKVTKNGCMISDVTTVLLFNDQEELGNDLLVCEEDFQVDLSVIQSVYDTLVWENGQQDNPRIISEPGTYWYTKTSGTCVASDTITIQSFSDDFLLYPNPVTEELNSTFPAETEVLRLVDELGRVLFEGNESLDGIQPLILSLPSAMYFIEVSVNGCRDFKVIEKVNRLE